jgi:hypothetical protein
VVEHINEERMGFMLKGLLVHPHICKLMTKKAHKIVVDIKVDEGGIIVGMVDNLPLLGNSFSA